jgi:hypothetical protein
MPDVDADGLPATLTSVNASDKLIIYDDSETDETQKTKKIAGSNIWTNETGNMTIENEGTGDNILIVADGTTLLTIDPDQGTVFVNGFLSTEKGPELTISSGEVTVTHNFHEIDTEADAATDDLIKINGAPIGATLKFTCAFSGRDVVFKDAAPGGNLQMNGDFTCTNKGDTIQFLVTDTGVLRELSRSKNT